MPKFDFLKMGYRISQQRISKGFTQQYVYEQLDISANHYSRIENGRSGMSFRVLVRLCEILNVSADYILTGRTTVCGIEFTDEITPVFLEKYAELSDKQKRFIMKQMEIMGEMGLK